ncbi:cold-inducible RNA-binding protein [Vigna unguiculata]|uniref:Cold-inducible RNA-binding protein n=1 Tax=Vigna unguiculata TaxID=3917 RepID=A0A4D6LJ29_VIGUN|nr:cold-inducible RNA-binding protein [Vigna unguiculata]
MDSPSPHFWRWKALDRRRRRGNRRRIGDSLTRLDREGESSACLFEWRGTPAEAPIEISGLDRKEKEEEKTGGVSDRRYLRFRAVAPAIVAAAYLFRIRLKNGRMRDCGACLNVFKISTERLSWDTNEPILKDAFEKHGEIIEVRVICDHVTAKSRGYGFVRFVSETAAATARKEMNDQILDGRRIRVAYAHKG